MTEPLRLHSPAEADFGFVPDRRTVPPASICRGHLIQNCPRGLSEAVRAAAMSPASSDAASMLAASTSIDTDRPLRDGCSSASPRESAARRPSGVRSVCRKVPLCPQDAPHREARRERCRPAVQVWLLLRKDPQKLRRKHGAVQREALACRQCPRLRIGAVRERGIPQDPSAARCRHALRRPRQPVGERDILAAPQICRTEHQQELFVEDPA